jgi:hypothetical protein
MVPLALTLEMEEEAFARAAGETIAGLAPLDRREGSLTLALLLSACLRRCGLDSRLDRACAALMRLRASLLRTSELDAMSEPVPLVVGDRRHAVLSLSVYLDELVERASLSGGLGRTAVVGAALAQLAG